MVLNYADAGKMEAVLLARMEKKIRVAVAGSNDVLKLDDEHGAWVTEDCERRVIQTQSGQQGA